MSSISNAPRRASAPRAPGRSAPAPENTLIAQLKQKLPLDEEIGKYVQLRPASGGELKGKCCFHEDNSPSLYVNPDAGTYSCHGCGAAGNVVTFISQMEGGDYETVKLELAERLGLLKPREVSGPERLLQSTAKRYQGALAGARNASAYLAGRGISAESIEKFGIGFCWGNEYLNATPSMIADAIKAGLYSERSGRSYLGGRITVPIRNHRGDVIAFGGRTIDRPKSEPEGAPQGESRQPPPKYLNTRETDYFVKAEVLYGLYESRAGIVKSGFAVAVEGYFDVITLNQHGADNAVALMGANSSPKAFEKLWKHTDNLIFCLDGDAAGEKGVMQSIYAAAQSMTDGKTIAVATLPPGMDPDEFIVEHGLEGWNSFMKGAAPLSEHITSKAASDFDMSCAEGRAGFLAHMASSAAMFEGAPLIRQGILDQAQQITHTQVVKHCLAGLRHGARPADVTDEAIRSIISSLEKSLGIKPENTAPAQERTATPSPAAAPQAQQDHAAPGEAREIKASPRRLQVGRVIARSTVQSPQRMMPKGTEPRRLTQLLSAAGMDSEDCPSPSTNEPHPPEAEQEQSAPPARRFAGPGRGRG